ncbi:MAG TPA: SRPBCC domain-containing protein [Bacteroidota bacterium]|nr:SRPBCC domain-containing protein [Bacteroidota bacterium]
MSSNDYHATISAKTSARDAMSKIGRVSEWWAKDFQGRSRKEGDNFTVRFGQTFVDFRIDHIVPDKKAVWEVVDCNLDWIKDKKEWKGTRIVWEIASKDGVVEVGMTHVGLVPGAECYNDCRVGWDGYIQKSLFKFMTEGEGLPDKF